MAVMREVMNNRELIDDKTAIVLLSDSKYWNRVKRSIIDGKFRLWKELPYKNSNGKFLFDWCKYNFRPMINWRDICTLKYPVSINMECE